MCNLAWSAFDCLGVRTPQESSNWTTDVGGMKVCINGDVLGRAGGVDRAELQRPIDEDLLEWTVDERKSCAADLAFDGGLLANETRVDKHDTRWSAKGSNTEALRTRWLRSIQCSKVAQQNARHCGFVSGAAEDRAIGGQDDPEAVAHLGSGDLEARQRLPLDHVRFERRSQALDNVRVLTHDLEMVATEVHAELLVSSHGAGLFVQSPVRFRQVVAGEGPLGLCVFAQVERC